MDGRDETRAGRRSRANWILAGLIAGVGVVAFVFTVRAGRADSALLFVGLPMLLLVGGFEGTAPGFRLAPDQSVETVRVVAVPAGDLAGRLAAGPRPTGVRSVPLRMLGVPVPRHVHGTGLEVGDRWTFSYHGTSHGPGGQLVAEVDSVTTDRIGFRFVEDTSITGRWLTWQRADLHWQAVDAGHSEIRLTVGYQRGLDPSWYFGPLQDVLLHEGTGHLLDMLDLR
ncbi:hypothetical protein O7626_37495 [Micromonospora sp. WMMD1102]|uniref:hypothetical protein n=1 Tax=Micromonospora sp. WMMD1102 TaxID=3016105 RepID=UPI002415276F|nr:hypothetical protein [Micromonospora sp. WMMD1102]MDG4791527.1 hypothetical protein [Micromonospora sp. WMMD1102]